MPSLKSYFLLDPTVSFLNHGSFGATPKPVFKEYQHWQRELENQPVEFLGRRITKLMGLGSSPQIPADRFSGLCFSAFPPG